MEAQTIDMEYRLKAAEQKIKQLSLLGEAMFSLLGEQLNLGETELQARILQVTEQRKTRVEAKFTCSDCGRQTNATRQKCMYCGGKLLDMREPSPFAF
jgi:DNA-directed RNA polymerase subunit RPC12/RpoP